MAEQDPNATAEAEPLTGEEARAAETNATPEAEAPTLTQAQFDAALASRLRSENDKYAAERAQYEREKAEYNAYIAGLQAQQAAQADPANETAGMTPEEVYLYKANMRASKGVNARIDAMDQKMQATLATLTAKETVEDYLATQGSSIPAEVKARTLQLYRQNISRGATPDGAFKLAGAEYAQRLFRGEVTQVAVEQEQRRTVAPQGRTQVPHTEVGGGGRRFTPPQTAGQKDYKTLREMFDDAEGSNAGVPEEGAGVGAKGARRLDPNNRKPWKD